MPDPLATIPLGAIRAFESAARLKSFTRAAEELGVSQAAVSWQVKALEKRLDQPLFRRLTREVALTPAGERLARAASEAMSALRGALADLDDSGQGVLAITTLQTLAGQWLAPRIGAFQVAHPQIAVRLESSNRLVDLTRDGIDVAIRSGDGLWPGLETHRLFPSSVTPLLSPSLAARLELSRPEDLFSATRIGVEDEWAEWFAVAGVAPGRPAGAPAPRLAADAQVLEMASVYAGQGVALGSPIFFAADVAAGRLVQPFEPAVTIGGDYWLCYPQERRRVKKITAFRDWLLAEAASDPAVIKANSTS
jgi:LysR family transcriptional regulator, glycine cleavage system transcriptional activator